MQWRCIEEIGDAVEINGRQWGLQAVGMMLRDRQPCQRLGTTVVRLIGAGHSVRFG